MSTNTLLHPLTLRRAEPADLQGILSLLTVTAEWLYRKGVRQWPRGGFGPERIEPLIDERVLYVLDDASGGGDGNGPDGETPPVATVALDGHADPEFWTRDDNPGAGLYVHKLAVARAWSGWGLGDLLLDWAGTAVASAGLRWLRLDCAKDNQGLQNYYQGKGFRHLRTVDLPHRASGALFQRPALTATATSEVVVRDLTASALLDI